MKYPLPNRNRQSAGFSLGEVLVVMVLSLVCIGGVIYMMVGGKSGNSLKDTVTHPVEIAKDVVCRENLRSVRQMIETKRAEDPEHMAPSTLSDAGVGSDLQKCPVGHEDYVYDPSTCEVHCIHPGHEKY